MKMSEEVSMVNRQLAEASGILSYAPTLPAVCTMVDLAAHASVACSMASEGAVATAVPASCHTPVWAQHSPSTSLDLTTRTSCYHATMQAGTT